MVEALWCNLKRLVLHNYNRPPVDLAVYALVRGSILPYRVTLSHILTTRPGGRPKGLSNMQEMFKKSWQRLTTVPIKGKYATNTTQWTYDCGAQKYHAYLLCKHLVQAVGDVPSSWWTRVQRFYTPPFFTVPINGEVSERRPESDRPCGAVIPHTVDTSDSDSDEVEGLIQGNDFSRSSESVRPNVIF